MRTKGIKETIKGSGMGKMKCLQCGNDSRWTALFCSNECKEKYNEREAVKKIAKKYKWSVFALSVGLFCVGAILATGILK